MQTIEKKEKVKLVAENFVTLPGNKCIPLEYRVYIAVYGSLGSFSHWQQYGKAYRQLWRARALYNSVTR